MGEAGALELVPDTGVDAVVLAEDESTGERRLGLRHPPRQSALRPLADLVERPGEAAAGALARLQALAPQGERDPPAAQLPRSPRLRVRQDTLGANRRSDRHLADRLGCDHEHPAGVGGDGNAHLAADVAGDGGNGPAQRDLRPRPRPKGARVDRVDPRPARQYAREPGEEADERQPGEGAIAGGAGPQRGKGGDRERDGAERLRWRARRGEWRQSQPGGESGKGRDPPLSSGGESSQG